MYRLFVSDAILEQQKNRDSVALSCTPSYVRYVCTHFDIDVKVHLAMRNKFTIITKSSHVHLIARTCGINSPSNILYLTIKQLNFHSIRKMVIQLVTKDDENRENIHPNHSEPSIKGFVQRNRAR
jgi:hypothetical protein